MHGIKAWQRRRNREKFGNYDMEPVDGSKYRTWRESFLEGASEMDDIWFWDLKEENIAILGAEKPD